MDELFEAELGVIICHWEISSSPTRLCCDNKTSLTQGISSSDCEGFIKASTINWTCNTNSIMLSILSIQCPEQAKNSGYGYELLRHLIV